MKLEGYGRGVAGGQKAIVITVVAIIRPADPQSDMCVKNCI